MTTLTVTLSPTEFLVYSVISASPGTLREVEATANRITGESVKRSEILAAIYSLIEQRVLVARDHSDRLGERKRYEVTDLGRASVWAALKGF
jgi:hypothetical protein